MGVCGVSCDLSATQDIAVDSYSIEMLKTSEMGVANGFRQAAYRIAMIISGGVFVAIGGWLGWNIAFIGAAVLLAVCGVVSLGLPAVELQTFCILRLVLGGSVQGSVFKTKCCPDHSVYPVSTSLVIWPWPP